MHYNLKGKKVFVAGHRGMVGSAVCRRLKDEDCEILTVDRKKIDLRDQSTVNQWMKDARPEVVILAAAKVGGIHANNTYPFDFLFDNLSIQNSVLSASHQCDVERLLFLGSSCIYPKLANQPIDEDQLLSGVLEPTNEPYAIAKIAGIKLVEATRRQFGRDWISAMPTNLYGPGDNYDLKNSHVLPALLRKFHTAKINEQSNVEIWGTGKPLREFMHCDDLADALIYLLKHYSADQHINVGTGHEVSIHDLASIIAKVLQYRAEIVFNPDYPDGTPRKLMDSSKLSDLGWKPKINLETGVALTYQNALKHGVFLKS